ncbi:MAG TPA: hypothetical protein VLF91_02745 [Candidatus Saccharimonadales bacterium]|nr:hypothetical protein [Candidatus Saccharimonadales bacterium]
MWLDIIQYGGALLYFLVGLYRLGGKHALEPGADEWQRKMRNKAVRSDTWMLFWASLNWYFMVPGWLIWRGCRALFRKGEKRELSRRQQKAEREALRLRIEAAASTEERLAIIADLDPTNMTGLLQDVPRDARVPAEVQDAQS